MDQGNWLEVWERGRENCFRCQDKWEWKWITAVCLKWLTVKLGMRTYNGSLFEMTLMFREMLKNHKVKWGE